MQDQRFLQAEPQHALGRDLDLLAARKCLSCEAAASACQRSDSCPFSASEDAPEQCAECGTSAQEFGGSLILAQALFVRFRQVGAGYPISFVVDRDLVQIQYHFRTVRDPTA